MAIDTQIQRLRYRRTKIVATLGPSSDDPETISRLIDAGADVFRLNMSHGSQDGHRVVYDSVRAHKPSGRRPTAVLVDLSGPKIRVGKFPDGSILLEQDQEITVTTRDVPGADGLIPSQYEALAADVDAGDRILLDDGNLEIEVQSVHGTEVRCRVLAGGRLKDHKGMNLPGVSLSTPSLTEKDRDDARFALELGADFLAMSFVRRPEDIEELRELIESEGGRAAIIAKIETPQALDNIDGIMRAADGIMVARGDLGVELPPQSVPLVQSQLIDLARAHAKPVIVATQMLESMVHQARPTRAEVSDVALAVRSGADAVMLSAESAAGRYPVASVAMMDTIARETEAYLWQQGHFGGLASAEPVTPPLATEDALARSTAQLSRDLQVRGILVVSRSGRTAAVMSASRPAAPIVATSPDPATCRMATLLWGVIPLTVEPEALADAAELARRLARDMGIASEGQKVLVVRGLGADPLRDIPSISVPTL